MREPDLHLCHSQSRACMQPSKMMSAMRRRIGTSLFSYHSNLNVREIVPGGWQGKCFRSHWRSYFVDQFELESDNRSDVTSNVTSNDVSVKVNDTLDGAQAATMVLEAGCAGSCLLRGRRRRDGRRTLR